LSHHTPEILVSDLVELANGHMAVQQRLKRMLMAGNPELLSAEFNKTLNA